jgi:TonB family protein
MKNRIAVFLLVLLPVLILLPSHDQAQDSSEGNRKVMAKVMPQYPAVLRPMNIQGTVRADVLVDPDGKVESVEVKGGHPLLAQAAENALRQWRWATAAHESHQIVNLVFKP